MTQTIPLTKGRIQQYWDKSATTYDNSYGHGLKTMIEKELWLDFLQQNIGRAKKQQILDVGSGTGFLSLLLAELGHSVTGIDLSEKMRDQADTKAKKAGLQVSFMQGDAEQPPFSPQSFDAIISRHVVWTLPSPHEALANWHKLLKPGGKVLIIDGIWTPRTAGSYIRWFLAGCIRLSQGRSNHLFWKKKYAKKGTLPFFGGAEPESLMALMTESGFTGIWHDPMQDILNHERDNGPLDYRITHGKNRRYLIGGKA